MFRGKGRVVDVDKLGRMRGREGWVDGVEGLVGGGISYVRPSR